MWIVVTCSEGHPDFRSLGTLSGKAPDGKWIVDLETPYPRGVWDRPLTRLALGVRYQGDEMPDDLRRWPDRVNGYLPAKGDDFDTDDWRLECILEVASLPMKPPIVCNDSPDPTSPGDLGVYDSIEWAEKGREPYDAEDPALQLYDSEGRLLKMQALCDTSTVRIEPAEVEPTHLDRLTSIVKQHLPRIDAPAELADRPLAEMLQYIYEADPNPYSGYRRPGEPQRGFWARLIDGLKPATRR